MNLLRLAPGGSILAQFRIRIYQKMKTQYHILNGDSLKQQFPESIKGEIIVAREYLVDGNVNGNSLDELFKNRAQFISQNYEGFNEQDYFKKSVPEFNKIQNIKNDADVNLWFEDDLFCQVNFWFILHLLNQEKKNNPIFLVRPKKHSQYAFGALNKSELLSIYENKLLLTELNKLDKLWEFYQKNDLKQLLKIAGILEPKYPFILAAVKAHINRIPVDGNLGQPTESLIQIMKELKTEEFGPVFIEFNKRESIYGYGDVQVKKLLDEIKNKHLKKLNPKI